ncbi:hypothetical protein [Mycoplasma sp. P36-A1]|uniref:hypothetical protein n=1 Tax=Mycoplasma sp. P36-A1 TaxID=3252900 RepID=UPI003C2DC464
MKKNIISFLVAIMLMFGFSTTVMQFNINAETTQTNNEAKAVDENGDVIEKEARVGIMPVSDNINEDNKAVDEKGNVIEKTAKQPENINKGFVIGQDTVIIIGAIVVTGIYYLLTKRNSFGNKDKGFLRKNLLTDMKKVDEEINNAKIERDKKRLARDAANVESDIKNIEQDKIRIEKENNSEEK